jgi:hypothetical protein
VPFLDDAQPAGLAPQIAEPMSTDSSAREGIRVKVPTPPIGRLVEAAFERENTIGSLRNWMYGGGLADRAPFDPAFDPFEGLEERFVPHAREFLHDNSPEDVDRTKRRIDDEQRRAELLDQGGFYGFLAQLGAGTLDPINLIPLGGGAVALYRSGQAATRLVGGARGAARLGAGFGVGQALQEGALQSTQLTRPWTESAFSVAGATLVGSVLGGSIGAFGR